MPGSRFIIQVYILEFLCRSGVSALRVHLADLLHWGVVFPGPQPLPSRMHADLAYHGPLPSNA